MANKEKTAWDRIPPINMELDENHSGARPMRQRKHPRTNLASLNKILDKKVSFLPVKLATASHGQLKGKILDISENGCRIALPVELERGELTKVGFIVNKRTIISRAIVRWIIPQNQVYLVGLEFQEMADDAKEFLWSVSAIALKDSGEIAKMKQALR